MLEPSPNAEFLYNSLAEKRDHNERSRTKGHLLFDLALHLIRNDRSNGLDSHLTR